MSELFKPIKLFYRKTLADFTSMNSEERGQLTRRAMQPILFIDATYICDSLHIDATYICDLLHVDATH